MRDKYRQRVPEVLVGTVKEAQVIERGDYDVIKLTYDDGTSVEVNSYSSVNSTLEVTERE